MSPNDLKSDNHDDASQAPPNEELARRQRIEDIFDAALEVPSEDRSAWLAAQCGPDTALRREVEGWLAAHARPHGILDGAVASGAAAALLRQSEHGRQIGPYRVLRELGRGGMGVVYLTERNDGQFRRRVAVKLLRASADADELRRRFLTERQILASLSHPNIAQLLDGGVADGQLPYLVIEYVDGLPITDYCDRQRLGLNERLRLFQDVCAAVHHAHKNLVLHRDLKPGNVLVTTEGQVKLLDFGIAKILNPSLTAMEQAVTRTAFRVMTPAYASPEQVRGETLTTASDVYALGLVLYELLTGHQAYDITSQAPHAVVQTICEIEPERPSQRVTRADAESGDPGRTPASISTARNSSPERLRRELQGDLDAIVMMALRKEPARRYGSAELFAADIARYLEGLPVLAHRGSRWYRTQKLLRRHRTAAVATAVALLALVGGASGAVWQAGIASRERDRATDALGESEAALRQSEEVTAFLVGLFEASDPVEGRLDTLTAADLLQRGTARAERLTSEPLVQARMLDALGRVHGGLGNTSRGIEFIRRALALRRTHLGDRHAETAATAERLAGLLMRQGEYAIADSVAREVLRVRRSILGDAHPDIASSLRQLSAIAVYLGNFAPAESLVREALAVNKHSTSTDDSLAVNDLHALGSILWRRGDLVGAQQTLREAVALSKRTHPSPNAANVIIQLRLAERLGDGAEAESVNREALAEARAALGDAHQVTALAKMQLGSLLSSRGPSSEGEQLLREGVAIQRRVYGPNHSAVANALDAFSQALARAGRIREAEELTQESIAIHERAYGPGHSAYAGALTGLAALLARRGALDSAEGLQRRALSIRAAALGAENPLTALTSANLAGILVKQRRYAEADSLYQRALTIMRRQISDAHPDVRNVHKGMAELYEAWGRPEDARRYRQLAQQ